MRALDNEHSQFCSCAGCIKFRYETRIRDIQQDYREHYAKPRLSRRFLVALGAALTLGAVWAAIYFLG